MKLHLLLCLPAALFLGSCAQDTLDGNTYSRNDARKVETVRTGRITDIQSVKIEGGSQVGTVGGAVAGGFLGNNIGSGRTANTAGTIGGALAGGLVGGHAQQAMTSRQGIRITISLDGRGTGTISVTQQVNKNEAFYVGDRVKVLDSGNGARVTH